MSDPLRNVCLCAGSEIRKLLFGEQTRPGGLRLLLAKTPLLFFDPGAVFFCKGKDGPVTGPKGRAQDDRPGPIDGDRHRLSIASPDLVVHGNLPADIVQESPPAFNRPVLCRADPGPPPGGQEGPGVV